MTKTADMEFELIDEDTEQKAAQVSEFITDVNAAFSQISIALADANHTLSTVTDPEEWQYGIIKVTGVLTAARDVVAPLNKKKYTFVNATTGGFAVTLKTSAGTGVPVSMGNSAEVRCDGTNIVERFTVPAASTQCIPIAVSDETTALTTGTAKVTFRMPFAFTLLSGAAGVRASVTTAPTGSVLTVDINEAGSSILSTKLTIDATEKTSTTAATPAVISDTSLADDAEITIDIDGVGSTIAGAGLKVYLIGTKI